MNIMLVSADPIDRNHLEKALAQAGRLAGNIFHYLHPLKAIDNLEELSPNLIFWNATSFPRHWKTLTSIYASGGEALLLFANSPLDAKEVDKATALHVAGIADKGLTSTEAQQLIAQLTQGHTTEAGASNPPTAPHANDSPTSTQPITPQPSCSEYKTQAGDKSALAMTHPHSLKLIHGAIISLGPRSITFRPQNSTAQIPPQTLLRGCHLKVRDQRFTFDLIMQQATEHWNLIIQDPSEEYHSFLALL